MRVLHIGSGTMNSSRATATATSSGAASIQAAALAVEAPGVDNARVAAEWPRWHAANRSTIGPDPNLILPGQRLRVPEQQSPADRASTDREESP